MIHDTFSLFRGVFMMTMISIPPWERITTQTRYGRYASYVEETLIKRALELLPVPTVALDIGCEGGRWTARLAEHGWQVIATEIRQDNLALCQQRVPSAQCVLVTPDQQTLPCADSSVRLILCIETPVVHSEWFPSEVTRIMQPGGLMVAVCWNRSSWRGWLYHHATRLRASGSSTAYGFPLAYPAFRARLRSMGWTFLSERGYSWLPFRRTSNNRLVPGAAWIEQGLGLHRLARLSPMIVFLARKEP